MQSYRQPLKQEGGISLILSDGRDASPDLLHQLLLLLVILPSVL